MRRARTFPSRYSEKSRWTPTFQAVSHEKRNAQSKVIRYFLGFAEHRIS